MTDDISRFHRIAKNSIFLYIRMILLMAVSLFTSRIVLETLGVEDYGIYNVVGGFVAIFAFLNGAMCSSTQRYITFYIGKGDISGLKDVFSTCVVVHGIIALIVFVLSETIGLWFVLNKLVVPAGQITAAIVVYQCSIVSTLILIMSFPFNADIISHEKMSAFAYISLLEAFAKLGVAYILIICPSDRLIVYSVLLLIVQVSVMSVYYVYCRRHFEETRFTLKYNRTLVKELFSFTGWNLWGGMAATLFSQGVNVLINMFFGPAVNAARGLAVQVQASVAQFAYSFQTAINPQITKTYALGETDTMISLVFRSSKFTFLLLLYIIVPIGSEIDWVLSVWLKKVPEYTDIFVLIMFGTTLIDSISNPLMIAANASGRVKVYQSVVGGILLAIVPVSYLVLKLGGEPYSVFIVHLSIAVIALVARLLILKKQMGLPVWLYIRNAILPGVEVMAVSVLVSGTISAISMNVDHNPILVMAINLISVIMFSVIIGLTRNEKAFVLNKFRQIVCKVLSK